MTAPKLGRGIWIWWLKLTNGQEIDKRITLDKERWNGSTFCESDRIEEGRFLTVPELRAVLKDAFRTGLLTEGTKADSAVVWEKYLKELGL